MSLTPALGEVATWLSRKVEEAEAAAESRDGPASRTGSKFEAFYEQAGAGPNRAAGCGSKDSRALASNALVVCRCEGFTSRAYSCVVDTMSVPLEDHL